MGETNSVSSKRVSLAAGPELQSLFGRGDEHARLVEEGLQVRLVVRDGMLTISGTETAVRVIVMAFGLRGAES